ncbi:MAG: hypothetical protein SFW64_06920 [Alphaproteobacteria bacterium]|nr:hypothetical protein [Alphaproteobacteria bacterium]
MNIISVRGDAIPQGTFSGGVTVIGATRAECLAALYHMVPFADDMGASVREDGLPVYTMVGGSIA